MTSRAPATVDPVRHPSGVLAAGDAFLAALELLEQLEVARDDVVVCHDDGTAERRAATDSGRVSTATTRSANRRQLRPGPLLPTSPSLTHPPCRRALNRDPRVRAWENADADVRSAEAAEKAGRHRVAPRSDEQAEATEPDWGMAACSSTR